MFRRHGNSKTADEKQDKKVKEEPVKEKKEKDTTSKKTDDKYSKDTSDKKDRKPATKNGSSDILYDDSNHETFRENTVESISPPSPKADKKKKASHKKKKAASDDFDDDIVRENTSPPEPPSSSTKNSALNTDLFLNKSAPKLTPKATKTKNDNYIPSSPPTKPRPELQPKPPSAAPFCVRLEGLQPTLSESFKKTLLLEEDISCTHVIDQYAFFSTEQDTLHVLDLKKVTLPGDIVITVVPDDLCVASVNPGLTQDVIEESLQFKYGFLPQKVLVNDKIWLRMQNSSHATKLLTDKTVKIKGKELSFYNPWSSVPSALARVMSPSLNSSKQDSSEPEIMTDVKVEKLIGKGQFGEVYIGKWVTSAVALKSFKVEDMEAIAREIDTFRSLRHPNCVLMYGLYKESNSKWFLVMEYLSLGSLDDFLQKNDGKIPVDDLLAISIQIATGMNYLHSKDILHNDLAARNVLLSKDDGKYVAKVSDFGLSFTAASDANYIYGNTSAAVPIRWSAPEVLMKRKFSKHSDVWSYGVTMWEIYNFAGQLPYWEIDDHKEVKIFVSKGGRLPKPTICPDDVWRHVSSCWAQLPHERPTFKELTERLTPKFGSVQVLYEV